MKKKQYIKPKQEVVQMHYSQMLCYSVIGPGENNRPAAAREFGDWDEEED
jgi:hypothetical protein